MINVYLLLDCRVRSGTSWVVMTVSADLEAGCVIMLSIFT